MPLNEDYAADLGKRGAAIHAILKEKGMYDEQKKYAVELHDGNVSYGEGYPIIGIEKFLGYYDGDLNIAYSPSISMTTDFSVAKAFCKYISKENSDTVILDGKTDQRYSKRMAKALENFKRIAGVSGSFQFYVTRQRKYVEAKGLGESAAVAAATARSLVSNVFGKTAAADRNFVSRCARLVSGSGTRSVAGGISLWMSYPGINEEECYAERMDMDYSKLKIFTCPEKSNIETINAHTAAVKSEFYQNWISGKYDRIEKLATTMPSIEEMGPLAEADMFRLDSVLMSSGAFVHNESSMRRITTATSSRKEGCAVYITADTGPSVVVMSTYKQSLDEMVEILDCKPLYGSVTDAPAGVAYKEDSKRAEEYFSSLETA